jgi:hypothetical protein
MTKVNARKNLARRLAAGSRSTTSASARHRSPIAHTPHSYKPSAVPITGPHLRHDPPP